MTLTAPTSVLERPGRPHGLPRLFTPGTATYAGSRAVFGELPGAHGLIEEIAAAGLTGRGGAAFPAATKLAAMERRGVVIANGSEGEPLSSKDAALLTHAPHLVLDGLELVGRAVHASRLMVVVKAKHEERVLRALAERPHGDRVRVQVTADAYVAGEASAVARVAAGGESKPVDRTVRLTAREFRRPPTLVQNVETLAHIALIARYGAAWFRTLGTAHDPGSRLLTLSGDVPAPGAIAVAGGTPIAAALDAAGAEPGRIRAVLVGGYHGTWVGPRAFGRPLVARADGEGVPAAAGALYALGQGACGIALTAGIARYLAAESAAQCGPCLNGLPALADALERLSAGRGDADLVRRIRGISGLVVGRGSCHHPDGTARMVASALDVFAEDVSAHLAGFCREVRR
ncbi:MAG: NADH-ubiquinone oxidoreductase-F iron-sulfur binding region domain-containing protein [Amnibacterium sp.]